MRNIGINKEFNEYVEREGFDGLLGNWAIAIYDVEDRLLCFSIEVNLVKVKEWLEMVSPVDCAVKNTGTMAWFKLVPEEFPDWELIGHVNSSKGVNLKVDDTNLMRGWVFTLDTLTITKRITDHA
jgi:hypothetical protein